MFLAGIKVLFWRQVWLSSCVKWFIRQERADIQQAKKVVSCQYWFDEESPDLMHQEALKVFSIKGLAAVIGHI